MSSLRPSPLGYTRHDPAETRPSRVVAVSDGVRTISLTYTPELHAMVSGHTISAFVAAATEALTYGPQKALTTGRAPF